MTGTLDRMGRGGGAGADPGADAAPFDVCGPLPQGTTVLEASAGTGKTYTIAALATRYVAEGLADLSGLMLVTFGRAATQELRERVRERLAAAEAGLAHPAAAREARDDSLLRLLAAVPDAEVAVRRRRLTRALAGFDAATIATTHGFCQQMLAGLGMAADYDSDATFVEQLEDLVAEVVSDLYLRKFSRAGAGEPAMDLACAAKVAREAMQDRQAALVPPDPDAGTAAEQRHGIARAVRAEVEARKRARRLLDFDDLLTRLRDALADPVTGAAAAERVRAQYSVVLVDEFQDTDPVQWEILRTAFHGHTTLILVGDPKQAVYAFRGADLVTYLDAVQAAGTRRTLARNWRSDAELLTGLHAVFGTAALGDPGIVVREVAAAHPRRRLSGAAAGAPLRLRVVPRDLFTLTSRGVPGVNDLRAFVAADVATDVVQLLSGAAVLGTDPGAAPRPLSPGHVAVLVRTHKQAVLVRDALKRANVPTVLTGTSSVFSSGPARDWLVLLTAIEQPHRTGLVRAAALTCFLGWTADRIAIAREEELDELGTRLRGWRDVLAGRGVAALLEVVTTSQGLAARLLQTPTGERDLTDLRHVGQALHAAAAAAALGPAALVEWLQRRIREAAGDETVERSRRLESDADAVHVVTVHASKGLEFPVVYVPYGWDRNAPENPDPLRLHDESGVRLLDVCGPGTTGYRERRAAHQREESGEDLRLLYVAMTRAQCQVVTWWAPSANTPASAMSRLLLGQFPPGGQPPATVSPVPGDAEAWRLLQDRADAAGGAVVLEEVERRPPAVWQPPSTPAAGLSAARFDRRLDEDWRRTSYSALTAAVHDAPAAPVGVDSEPEVQERTDEAALPPAAPLPASGEEERLRAVPSPMADLPAGTAFGSLVHTVLETVDTAAAELEGELRERCREAVAGRYATSVAPTPLAVGLLPVLETPLGPLAGDRRLRDIAPADRLAELDFELPLAGGDRLGAASGTLAAVAALLRRHLPRGDPLAAYPDALAVPALAEQHLRGYLTGSIDAVLRTGGPDPRYLIVDYKTNWLGDAGPRDGEPLTAWEYRPAALADAMIRSHYPLQALLYAVALHRYLGWRQPGYDPARHLGGVLYLFVRGMCGPSTPVVDGSPCGVFSWQPPAPLVVELSELLAGGAR